MQKPFEGENSTKSRMLSGSTSAYTKYSQKFRVDRAGAFFFGGKTTDHRVYAELFLWCIDDTYGGVPQK